MSRIPPSLTMKEAISTLRQTARPTDTRWMRSFAPAPGAGILHPVPRTRGWLPQPRNIFQGDMSFVGLRVLLPVESVISLSFWITFGGK